MISLSVDDGCASDIRVASLAMEYKVPTVFYWPVEWHSLALDNGYEPLTYKEAITISKQFEIGSHTITHRHLTKLPVDQACIEIAESQQVLREMFNQPIRKFCPPRGYSNPELTNFTMQFYDEQRLTKGDNLVHVHPDSGANYNMPWREVLKDKQAKTPDIELWLHSWELDKFNLWEELEEVLSERSPSK